LERATVFGKRVRATVFSEITSQFLESARLNVYQVHATFFKKRAPNFSENAPVGCITPRKQNLTFASNIVDRNLFPFEVTT